MILSNRFSKPIAFNLGRSLFALSGVCAALALEPLPAVAQADAPSNPGYYRAPTLQHNTLVFTAEGDLWVQTLGQPHATRLTSLSAEEWGAKLSHDGQWVAYNADYEGASEVYVIPVSGGVAKRVSFENSRVRVQGWTASGEVLYATDNAFGPANYWVLKTVNPDTLIGAELPLADAIEGVVDDKGEYVYFSRFGLQATGDNAKVYRGGARGELWRYRLGSDKEAELLSKDHPGSVRQPMLWQDRLYFISDGDGNDNLWSMALDGADVRQHSHYSDWQIRGAAMDEGRLVFQQGADLKLYDVASGTDSTLDIRLLSDFPARREHWVKDPLDYITAAHFSPKGDKAVITARSQVAVAGIDGSRLVTLNIEPRSRISGAVFSPDGNWVYAISNASGEQEIWQYPADGSKGARQLTSNGSSMRMSLNVSADGRYLAHDDYDGNVWLLDLKSGKDRKIVTQGEGLGPYSDIVWSKDSQFIALTKSEIGKQRPQIVLYSLAEDRAMSVTSDKYESFSPSFSEDGNWLYFLSNRAFNATPGSPWGDRNMGPVFDKRTLVFALGLNANASFPFKAPDELSPQESDAEADKKAKIPKWSLNWSQLASNLWQVPVPAGNYSRLNVASDRLYLLDQPMGADPVPALKYIKFDAQSASNSSPKVEPFGEDVADYELSADGKKLFLRRHSNGGKELLIVAAGDKLPAELSGTKVQTQGWQLALSPMQEWQQMFDDAWLMHRDSFFDKQMRGVDWLGMRQKYQLLLSRLTDRHELNDILMQMMGELDALHSQVRGGDVPQDPDKPMAASLGARLEQTDKGVRIAHIYRNDPELPTMAAPLARMGVDAAKGDVIKAINHKPALSIADVTLLLRNQSNRQVLLELQRAGKTHKTIVVPVDSRQDAQLRYLDWVANNAAKVTAAGKGKFGYLHLYAMGSEDIASFAREFYANYDKQGLIIDVRRNRGGNIDSWIIEKLLRRAWAFWQPTHGTPSSNMQQTFRGHLVVLTDQLTYSDGETFSAGIRALGLAPLVGKQTAGAGVWLSGRNALADNGMARVAEYPQYAIDGRWVLEGHGVEPDIEVDNLPYATFAGKDAQLERALAYLQETLAKQAVPPLKALPMPPRGKAEDIASSE